ncbi:MAG: hypothetical protein PWP03_473 [Candidatus Woesearchaeota archaeon]|nr:hypothetical protein [Candidatus Woesearchaeota archaeon]MDN5327835.1 hypothetical protein [Candidatus Woesearchaeota archaeon]
MKSKNKNYLTVIILFSISFFLILTLSSCNFSNSSNQPPNYYSGYKAVDVELEPLVQSASRKSLLPLKITIINEGAYDASGLFFLSYPFPYLTFNKSQMSLFQDNQKGLAVYNTSTKRFGKNIDAVLKGKNMNHPFSDTKIDLIYLKPNLMMTQSEKMFTISLDYCYNYSIFVNVPLCINPNYDLSSIESVCKVEPIYLSGGQGSIVSVDRIEPVEYLDGNNIVLILKIYLVNHGSGEITDAEITDCFSKEDSNTNLFEAKRIRLRDLKIGNHAYNELAKEYPLNEDNSFEIEVPLKNKDVGPYKTPLSFTIDYGYKDSRSVQVTVK